MKTTNNNVKRMKRKKIEETPVSVFWKAPKKINFKRIKSKTKSQVPLNFFAIKPIQKNKSKKVSNNLFGFNNTVPKRPVALKNKDRMRLFTPVQMKPLSYAAKESITQKRKLNPWGDADLDGSPNQFDCDPRNAAKDGIFARALGMISGGKYGQTKEEYSAERQEKRLSKFSMAAIGLEKEKREARAARKEFGNLAQQRVTELSLGEGIKLSPEQVEKVGAQARALSREEQEAAINKYETRTPSKTKIVTEYIKERGKELIDAGRSPKSKRISEINQEIARIESKGGSTLKLKEQRDRLKREREQGRNKAIGGILSALTPLGAVPEVRRLTQTKSSSGTGTKKGGGRGRPKGPSGKYMINGEAVSESEFQQVRSIENKKRRAMGIAKVPTGSFQLDTVKQAVRREDSNQAVEEIEGEEVLQEEEFSREQPQQSQQQPQQVRRQMTVQEMQSQEQRDDNILHAPNFQKGELTQTAGAFQDDPKFNILNAPNFQKGELRKVGETRETSIITVGERPNPNPYGEEYTDIDPGSGRAIVQRRPQEKWATGEAL